MNRSARTAGGLRVIRDDPGPAAWNMAVDEALLSHAEVPTLRLYGWTPHAVSLGWFQRAADFADLPPGTPIVRRLTGGGAIHHGDEITFALCVDAELLPREVDASYHLLHDAAIAALREHGIASERLTGGDLPTARPTEKWCFRTPGRDDVVTPAGKLLGSAQRRIAKPRARVLHHGSLVLQRPTLTPFVAAVADTATDPSTAARVREALIANFAQALGLPMHAGTLTATEHAAAERLRRERYEDPGFLRAR
ncbi:MAG: lipoate--protein ligase family protein [Planctomycetes bacterium]|nr:lipoate--protein ligase family protein [Planctomycetota bacterium]